MVSKAEELLQKVKEEKDSREKKLKEKEKANSFFAKVFEAESLTHNKVVAHPETKKIMGRKFRYIEDGNGKNIYDYVCYNENPEEKEFLKKLDVQFDKDDPKDGSWVNGRVKVNWKDRNY